MSKRWFRKACCERCDARFWAWGKLLRHFTESRACYYGWMMRERINHGYPPLPMMCVAAYLVRNGKLDKYLIDMIVDYYGKEEAYKKMDWEFEIALEMKANAAS